MRITVDRDTCEGLGRCEAMAHEFFELDDDEAEQGRRGRLLGWGRAQPPVRPDDPQPA